MRCTAQWGEPSSLPLSLYILTALCCLGQVALCRCLFFTERLGLPPALSCPVSLKLVAKTPKEEMLHGSQSYFSPLWGDTSISSRDHTGDQTSEGKSSILVCRVSCLLGLLSQSFKQAIYWLGSWSPKTLQTSWKEDRPSKPPLLGIHMFKGAPSFFPSSEETCQERNNMQSSRRLSLAILIHIGTERS